MRFRNPRLRTKVAALLVSLTALWAFAAWVTLREGVNLLGVAALDSNIAQPTDPLLAELQQERRLSVIQLVSPGSRERAALQAQRARTDKARATVRRLARSGGVKRAAGETLEKRIDESLNLLNKLDSIRATVDSGVADRGGIAAEYSTAIESIFRVYDSLATLDDKEFAKDTTALLELNRMWEVLSQEDALVAGALAAGRLTSAEHTEFTQVVGMRRFNTDRVALRIQEYDPNAYRQLTQSANLAHVQSLEDQIIQGGQASRAGRAGTRSTVNAQQWSTATQPALAELRGTIQASGDRLVERAKPIAAGVVIRLVLAGGLGLIAVIASIILSITTTRALLAQLEQLRQAALELAEKRLPSVVERLGRGEDVDVTTEAPPLEFGKDEVGQVGHAFNAVQRTAIRSAVQQAELRRGIRDILLSLARRTQALVHRQLALLDTMERREIDTAELEDLFRLDHLATRMRRNAENLIVLSGATPARGWRRSVPMVDVVRAAVAEVEDYARVTVLPMGSLALAGRGVGDIIHLLAELIENAVSFSPQPAMVHVSAQFTARGYAIEIEDRGLGIAEDRLRAINERIGNPPEFNLSRSVQLGLYVVARLAARYGIRVTLKNSAYGGTTAVVLIPNDLLIEDADETVGNEASAGGHGAPAGAVTVAVQPATRSEAVQFATLAAIESSENTRTNGGDVAMAEAVGTPEDASEPPASPALAAFTEQRTNPKHALDDRGPGTTYAGGTRSESRPDGAEPDHEPDHEGAATMSLTPSGLPVRIPQASLTPPLRANGPSRSEKADDSDDDRRSPEEVRKLVGSYLTGAYKGRSDAAKALRDKRAPQPPPAAAADESSD